MTRPFTSPPSLVLLGEELRIARKARGLTQEQLACRVYCTNSLISMLELAQRVPKQDLIERLDASLDCDGRLVRLLKLVERDGLPGWAAALLEAEALAIAIRAFHPGIFPGLVQTQAYARVMLDAGLFGEGDEDELRDRVERRLSRQQVLSAGALQAYHLIIGEAALHQIVGDQNVTSEQLAHLLDLMRRRMITVQVLPYRVSAYSPPAPLTIFDLGDGTQIVHLEGPLGGETTSDTEAISTCIKTFDLLRSEAASLRESAGMIEARLEELRP